MLDPRQVPMFADLPMDNPSAAVKPVNCLQDMFIELINERRVELADIQKGTGIPWSTLHGWYIGDVKSQMLDKNVLKLAQFFNVSLEYLAFGIGPESKEDEVHVELRKGA